MEVTIANLRGIVSYPLEKCITHKEADEEDGRQENSTMETDKTIGALEAIPMHLNCG